MNEFVLYPSDIREFDRILEDVARVLGTDRRLPDWPFNVATGNTDICQFSLAIAGPFGPVLQALVDTHGDETVSLVVFDPSPDYYRENYGSYPVFMASGSTIATTYWDLVAHEPGGDPTGAVIYTANVVAVVGSSGAWGTWAERSWDLAVVLSQHVNGPWTSRGVDFVSAEEALATFTEPDYKMALPAHERATFLRNVHARGRAQ